MKRLDPEIRANVVYRARGFCEICGRPYNDVHHRRPRGIGGSRKQDVLSNLLALCRQCHRRVESDRSEALDKGWLVKQGADPADIPVETYVGVFLLDNDEPSYQLQ